MRITALAGGVGGARFLRGLRAHLDRTPTLSDATVTVIGNTGDDINLFGLRVCPDLDTVMYTLGGAVDEEQGWGRADETHSVQGELAAYGAQPQWFGLGDRDFGTHIVRSQWLGQGLSLSEVTARLCDCCRCRTPPCRPTSSSAARGRILQEPSISRSGGSACTPPSPHRSSSPWAWTVPPPRQGCSTPSGRPTSSCSRRATQSCPSASS